MEKKASAHCFKRSGPKRRMRLRTCPMGWIQAVDFIEDLQMETCKAAGLNPKDFIALGAPIPNLHREIPCNWFSFYVDNFDQGRIVLRTDLNEYEFRPSGEQIALRNTWAKFGLEHDVKLIEQSSAFAPGDSATILRVQSGPNRRSRPVARRWTSTMPTSSG